ncbi:hypothetical protein ACVMB3_005571 [Sinorhizobium meliloti]|uniref:hypothetical protein n=2 Tax=Rhizobium meliloti TaxID=382 RepID=UPI0002F9C8BF|nr:hypothetical protein [Sinorhizobium meliloti]PST29054.1 hypothetical protein C7U62_05080 [Mesorhizobium loti]ASP82348.1 hypothetical protein CDO27_31810 [Sinorhizobium meliloti]ATA97431.1 hypothetical protein BWO76_13545 [Sinorhizobium meliloti]ATB03127.1 hypothetical protein BWO90_12640 [Sinorhizobium meliloti]KKA11744.1 hypothetical protein VP03_22600 [Sinorhizobium meliloti]
MRGGTNAQTLFKPVIEVADRHARHAASFFIDGNLIVDCSGGKARVREIRSRLPTDFWLHVLPWIIRDCMSEAYSDAVDGK